MTDSTREAVSWRDIFQGPRVGVFVVLCFGVWLYAADSTVIATLLPSVVAEVGGEAYIAWTFVLYRLASIAAAVSAAIIGRIVGLRRAMVWAALVMAIGCAVSALTPNMAGMLIGRTIQGLGGGVLVALTMIGVSSLFPSRYTPRLMAAISAVWGSSAFLGPLVGGIFAEYGDWRLGFWAFAVQGLLLAAALHWALPADEQVEDKGSRLAWRRLSVLAAAIMAIATAGIERDSVALVTLLCVAGLAGLALFLRLDRAADPKDRLLPRDVADIRGTAGVGYVGIFLIAAATIPFTVYGPVLVSVLHGVGPLGAGYLIALESVSWTLGALTFSSLSGRHQTLLIRFSFLAILISVIGKATFVASGPVWMLFPFLFLSGLGFGSCFGHVLQRCVEAVPAEDKDRAAGAITTVQTIGYTLGGAVCGLAANLVGYVDGAGVEAASRAGVWTFAVMIPPALAAALLILRFGRREEGA
jgi:MFS family permease